MQKSRNFIDGHMRENNLIITGMSENYIKVKDDDGNDILLQSDRIKVKYLFKLISCSAFTIEEIEQFEIERIRKQRVGYNCTVKEIGSTVMPLWKILKF